MTDDADLMTDLDSEGAFEVQMRGYSRRQVDEFVARSRSQTRDLEERLSQSLDEVVELGARLRELARWTGRNVDPDIVAQEAEAS